MIDSHLQKDGGGGGLTLRVFSRLSTIIVTLVCPVCVGGLGGGGGCFHHN